MKKCRSGLMFDAENKTDFLLLNCNEIQTNCNRFLHIRLSDIRGQNGQVVQRHKGMMVGQFYARLAGQLGK